MDSSLSGTSVDRLVLALVLQRWGLCLSKVHSGTFFLLRYPYAFQLTNSGLVVLTPRQFNLNTVRSAHHDTRS